MDDRSYTSALVCGACLVLTSVSAYASPPPELTVSEWAEQHRVVTAESGSRHPGKWQNSRTPYLVEIMDVSGVNHPNPRTVICGGAQIGKSEVGLAVLGHMIDTAPRPAMTVLPSQDEVSKYNAEKFDQMVQGSTNLTLKVMPSSQRSNKGSTTTQKKFRGGKLGLVSAGSSKGFNMISIGLLILEELAEYEDDVDNRGAPDSLARTRGDGWEDEFKEIDISTTGEEGACKITKAYDGGDQRLYFLPCPECGDFAPLEFENMKWDEGRAVMACPSCGVLIEHHQKQDMLAGGVWLPTFKSENPNNVSPTAPVAPEDIEKYRHRDLEGRYHSYHLWQAYSAFKGWDSILKAWEEAKEDPLLMKAFFQQKLAQPYEPQIDKPMADDLHAVCTPNPTDGKVLLPADIERRSIPDFAPILILTCDQQGDRLEWAVWAFGPKNVAARIDWGIIPGVPGDMATWEAFWNEVCQKRYETETMGPLGFDDIGVDTGGRFTQQAYQFCAAHRGNIKALKGKPNDRFAPPISVSAKGVRVRRPGGSKTYLPLYLVGTDGLKTKVYHGLSQIFDSAEAKQILPGTLMLTPDSSLESFKQLTAENPVPQKNGGIKWEKIAYQANEQLDLAVYAQALAAEMGVPNWTAEQWQTRFEERRKPNAIIGAGPLEALMHEEQSPAPPKPALNTKDRGATLDVLLGNSPSGGGNA